MRLRYRRSAACLRRSPHSPCFLQLCHNFRNGRGPYTRCWALATQGSGRRASSPPSASSRCFLGLKAPDHRSDHDRRDVPGHVRVDLRPSSAPSSQLRYYSLLFVVVFLGGPRAWLNWQSEARRRGSAESSERLHRLRRAGRAGRRTAGSRAVFYDSRSRNQKIRFGSSRSGPAG